MKRKIFLLFQILIPFAKLHTYLPTFLYLVFVAYKILFQFQNCFCCFCLLVKVQYIKNVSNFKITIIIFLKMTWKMHFSIATYIYLVLSFQVIFLHSPTIEVPTYYCLNINHIGLEFKKLCTEVR